MKDQEMIEQLYNENKSQISVFRQIIHYCNTEIKKLEEFDARDDFYKGNIEYPDYPGNEWMKENNNE
jgi:hypothetical protein